MERKAPDMKRLSRPPRSSRRREVRRGRRASREASVMLLPGSARLSSFGPRHTPTWGDTGGHRRTQVDGERLKINGLKGKWGSEAERLGDSAEGKQ